jgi:hypothetical protein
MVAESAKSGPVPWSITLQGVLGGAKASATAAKKNALLLKEALFYLCDNADFPSGGTWNAGANEGKKRALEVLEYVATDVLEEGSIGTFSAAKRLKLMSQIQFKLNSKGGTHEALTKAAATAAGGASDGDAAAAEENDDDA